MNEEGSVATSRRPSGLQYMGLSALCFSLMAALVKLGGNSIPAQELIAFRSLFIIAITIPILRRRGVRLLGVSRGWLALRGLFGYVAMSCYFWTLQALPVADAMVIQYTSPIFTMLWAALLLREHPASGIWLVAVLCMTGVVVVAKPEGSGDPLVALVGVAGAALAGAAYAVVRRLRTTDDAYTIVFYFPLVSLPFSLLLAIPIWQWPADLEEWTLVMAVCVTSYLGQVFLTRSLERTEAGRAVMVNYISVALGVLFGCVLFHTTPDLRSVIGIVLILAGVTLLAHRADRALSRQLREGNSNKEN